MIRKRALVIFLLLAIAYPATLLAQREATSSTASLPPQLTLEDAVSLALENNRLVKNSVLEAQKFDFRVSTARSRRLPQFQFSATGGELLQPFNFTFARGAWGTFPGIGPIPSTETEVHTPARLFAFLSGHIDQPLSQQYRIGLGIRATELGRQIAREDVRAERQKIAAEVRTAYFELVATQAGVEAAREEVKTLEEAQRVTMRYIAEKTVLRGDALEVDARLEKSRYELSVAENGLATEREHLNQLLGRDLGTRFRVDSMVEEDATDLTLDAARDKASQNRPEVRQASLKEKQAEYDRRIAKADYIPDFGISVGYLGVQDVQVLPTNVVYAGFLLTWEPFDWGRRHNKVAEKAKTVEQARNGARETESQIAVEVGAKYRKWKEAALLLKATRTGHQAAAEQFRTTSNKYKEQAALIKDVLQAQARSTETEFQYQQALSSYWSVLAELRRAMGDE
jgi:outer membrane protein